MVEPGAAARRSRDTVDGAAIFVPGAVESCHGMFVERAFVSANDQFMAFLCDAVLLPLFRYWTSVVNYIFMTMHLFGSSSIC